MTSTNDLLDRLAAARPTDADLDAAWPADERAALLARVRTQAAGRSVPAAGPRRSRRRTAWLAAAAVVVPLAVVPPVLDAGDAQARAEILQIAAEVGQADGIVIEPGTFLHVRTQDRQHNSSLFGDGRTLDDDREKWVRWDGAQWIAGTRPSRGWTEYTHVPAPGPQDGFGRPTPQSVASLPDAPGALRAYLDENVSGSNSHDEALFTAVTDLALSHLLDPATLAVALEAIADVDGVRTREVTLDGREAVEISYRRFFLDALGVESFTIDTRTAQVLRQESSDPGGTYTSTTTLVAVVEEVPADVLAVFDEHGSGTTLCPDGRPMGRDEVC